MDLPDADHRHLQAAIGWLELGDHLEADKELDQITPQLRAHPDILGVRWQVYARAGKWKACVELAHAVVKMDPDRLAAWMDRATGLRHADGLQAAYESIMPALVRFPRSPLVPYTLARYTCQMGQLDDARVWMDRAFSLASKRSEKKALKLMALEEPDLEPLWASPGK